MKGWMWGLFALVVAVWVLIGAPLLVFAVTSTPAERHVTYLFMTRHVLMDGCQDLLHNTGQLWPNGTQVGDCECWDGWLYCEQTPVP